jgi:curved DNA-binding protein CbpA
MSKFRTHYDNLKVARNAPDAVIRAAYRALIQKYHPDKYEGSQQDALKITKVINSSYGVLIDPIKRAEHDQWILNNECNVNVKYQSTEAAFQDIQPKKNVKNIYTEEDIFSIAISELSSGELDHETMDQSLSESNEIPRKAAARYIQLRVIDLKESLLQKSQTMANKEDKRSDAFYINKLNEVGYKFNTSKKSDKILYTATSDEGQVIEFSTLTDINLFLENIAQVKNKVNVKNEKDRRIVLAFLSFIVAVIVFFIGSVYKYNVLLFLGSILIIIIPFYIIYLVISRVVVFFIKKQ